MDSLYKDKFAEYFRDSGHAAVVQRWSEATASMTEEEFRAGVERLAELIERERLPNAIVDVVKMAYRPAADFEEWRQAHIIPRYNAAGVRKFAFIYPNGFSDTVENGVAPAPEGKAAFPFGYFGTRERAFAWLATQ
jgi:hypothetical protein